MKRSRRENLLQFCMLRPVKRSARPLLHLRAIPSYLDRRIAEAKESKECVE